MDTRRVKVLVEWDPEDRVYVTTVPAFNYLSDYGDTREEALERTRDAIAGYLEVAAEKGLPVPPETDLEIVELEVPV